MKKICQRCSAEFECKNHNILECDCVTVMLTAEDRDYISANYSDCLCIKCLLEISSVEQPEVAACNCHK